MAVTTPHFKIIIAEVLFLYVYFKTLYQNSFSLNTIIKLNEDFDGL